MSGQRGTGARALPLKRPPRPTGRSRPHPSPTEIVRWVAGWDEFHSLAARLPHWRPGDIGRPPDLPPAAVLLFWMMRDEWTSERKIEEQLRDPVVWEPIRQELHRRYPAYRGLAPGASSISRSEYRYYMNTYAIADDVLKEFARDFTVLWCQEAQRIGLFDETRRSWTHPLAENFATGDGTWFKSRFRSGPGEEQVDTITGEIVEKPYDPDAEWYWVDENGRHADDEGRRSQRIRGTYFGTINAWLPYERERFILDVFNIRPSRGETEADKAIEHITNLVPLLPGLQGVAWDMALRGKHNDQLYHLGLLPLNKVARAKGGKPKSLALGTYAFMRDGVTVADCTVFVHDGQPGIEIPVAGEVRWVPLARQQTKRQPQRSAGYRWYGVYAVPDEPPYPLHLRGATTILRLDTTEDDRTRRRNRAENLRAISQSDPDWDRMFALRPKAESVNRRLKDRLRDRRAPAVGIPRQLWAALGAAFYTNVQALLAHEARLAGSGPSPPETDLPAVA